MNACSEGGGHKEGSLILNLRVPPQNRIILNNRLRVPLKGALEGAALNEAFDHTYCYSLTKTICGVVSLWCCLADLCVHVCCLILHDEQFISL